MISWRVVTVHLTSKLSDVRRQARLSGKEAPEEQEMAGRKSQAHVRWSAVVRPGCVYGAVISTRKTVLRKVTTDDADEHG